MVPEDSASAQVSPMHGLTGALDVLTLVRDITFIEEDVVMDHVRPDGFEEALQSFRAVQAELDNVLADDGNGKLNVSHQLRRRRAGPPMTLVEEALDEVFMEQGIAGPPPPPNTKQGLGHSLWKMMKVLSCQVWTVS